MLRVPRFAPRGESLAALAACTIAALLISRNLLRADVFSDDAFVHQFWMWHFRDAALFNDPLTSELRESERYPVGYVALFWLATHVAGPITFGEWLGVALMGGSAWLVWLIVREQTPWRPGPWIGAALFLALIDIHRFYGGFPRAFVHPVVLLTVLLAMQRRQALAAMTAGAGALFYPPAALLAVGVLVLSAFPWRDRRRLALAGLAVALAAACVLVPRLIAGGAPHVLSASEARAFPEFGAHGPLHFFVPSAIEYLRQNRSGFDLRTSGSILALAALALLLVRPGNWRLLRREVLAMPIVSLGAWGLAQLVLFQLYLPHRYTYPLVAFFAIVVGVTLQPTWAALAGRSRAPAVASLGALLSGVALVAAMLVGTDHWNRGQRCPTGPAVKYLATLPKDAVIAGDPIDLKCLPATTRRAVVISTQLAPSYEKEYFLRGRERMFDTLRAVYGPNTDALADVQQRYGATDLWIRRGLVEQELRPRGFRWRSRQAPYGQFVRQLLSDGEPVALHLPAACRRFQRGPEEVYDIGCLVSR
jgi:hypothetical protein